MAKLVLSSPPVLPHPPKYSFYRNWLEQEFFRHVCCYCCLDSGDGTEIEHFVPQSYSPSLSHDPHNLLLACPKCNKLKLDYHPAHSLRQKLRADKTGHRVLDPRTDDYSQIFSLDCDSGCITGNTNRANWNILLFDFHLRHNLSEKRRLYVQLVKCLDAFLGKKNSPPVSSHPWANTTCDMLAQYGYLFLVAFDIDMSTRLRDLLTARRADILARPAT